jgi:predicted Zn-dependent peptidase
MPASRAAKAQQLANLAELSSEPEFLARAAFVAAAFGVDHPYGHTSEGTRLGLGRSTARVQPLARRP